MGHVDWGKICDTHRWLCPEASTLPPVTVSRIFTLNTVHLSETSVKIELTTNGTNDPDVDVNVQDDYPQAGLGKWKTTLIFGKNRERP